MYFFDPAGIDVKAGQSVIVETSKGLEMGECVADNHQVSDERIIPPLRPVIRLASEEDLRLAEINKSRESEAFEICKGKIKEHGLDMKLVDAECNFEGNKILFFFTSDGRVDFRELVKDLASIFRTRIELRQIGVRDEAKMQGGLGICGREFCCSKFLDEFSPVSTKMAKTQSMSLNPTKISGSCGRLMCCLRYEQDAYEDLVKNMPKNGAFVQTVSGYGNAVQINLLRQKVKVRLDGEGDEIIKLFDADEVAAVPGGRPKPGEPLPSVLKPKPKPKTEEKEPEDDYFSAVPIFRTLPNAESLKPEPSIEEKHPVKSRHRNKSRGKRKQPGEKPSGVGQTESINDKQAPPRIIKSGSPLQPHRTQAEAGAGTDKISRGEPADSKQADRPKRRRYRKPKPKKAEGTSNNE